MNENNKIIRIGILLIVLAYILYLLFDSFIKTTDIKSLIIIIIFSVAVILSIVSTILKISGYYGAGIKLTNISAAMISVIWFGMLIFVGYMFIKEKNYINLLLLIPFILLGIIMIYNRLIKNR